MQDTQILVGASSLPVGALAVIGKYASDTMAEPIDIVWRKISEPRIGTSTFISEYVVDYLTFDARERPFNGGNPDVALSNIFQFANSEMEDWFSEQHDEDVPPENYYNARYCYVEHYGFLNKFRDYELQSISGDVRLPTSDDMSSGWFGSHGKRPHINPHERSQRLTGLFSTEEFVDFWLQEEPRNRRATFYSRSCSQYQDYPINGHGFRPVIDIVGTTNFRIREDGKWEIVPFEATKRSSKYFTDEQFSEFMSI